MRSIDLNCDMGESFGPWTMGDDEALIDYVSSVNIACGFHAGDAATMQKTVRLAFERNVAIGAHPGFPDLQGFGRRNMQLSPKEVYGLVLYQMGALAAFVKAAGAKLHHVKPHGALYNMAAKDAALARAIAQAVRDLDNSLILYGLSGSYLIHEANTLGLRTANEVFADRTYQGDGSLTPRHQTNALLTNTADSMQQVVQMVKEGTVQTNDNQSIAIQADTICIHGDGAHAVSFAKAISQMLLDTGISIKPV